MQSRTVGYQAIKAKACNVDYRSATCPGYTVFQLFAFNFDVDRGKAIIHSRIINLAVLRRSWRDVDAFTLQIYRYSQALIDLAKLIRYCVAGEVCMEKQLCGVCSNG